MQEVKLTVKNGIFTDVEGLDNITQRSNKRVTALGWICSIEDDGSIDCHTAEGGAASRILTYHIRADGFARLSVRVPGERPHTKKKGYVIKRGGKLEGIIGLSGGEFDKRYAYFFK